MQMQRRRDMTPEQRRQSDRDVAQKALDGTWLVPTKTCIHCGSRARQLLDAHLELHEGLTTGTAAVPVVVCQDGCKKATVSRTAGMGNFPWRYGRDYVVIVDGPAYVIRDLPQPITERQRAMMQEFLAETA